MLLLTVLLAVFRWESGGVMDGHDAKIHSDQCSGNAGRLSSTVPDWSESDSAERQWLDANLFLLPTSNVCAELTTVPASLLAGSALSLWPRSARWALGFTGRGEFVWSWQAKVHIKPGQSRVMQLSCLLPLGPQCPQGAGWLNGTLVSPWSADKLDSWALYCSTGAFFLILPSFWQVSRVGTALPKHLELQGKAVCSWWVWNVLASCVRWDSLWQIHRHQLGLDWTGINHKWGVWITVTVPCACTKPEEGN